MIQPVSLRFRDRTADFRLDLDPAVVSDHAILWYLQQGQPCEPEVVHVMMRAIDPGDFVVDAGANVGFFTLLMSSLVGPAGSVLAIEPGSNNLPRLARNIAINNGEASNIVVCDSVLAAKAGETTFWLNRDNGQNASYPSDDEGSAVGILRATTLDALCQDTPKLIKMDIEGSEWAALSGATTLLFRHPPFIVMELNEKALGRMGSSAKHICDHMKTHGYGCFLLSEAGEPPFYMSEQSLRLWNPQRENTNVLFSTHEDVRRIWV